MTGTHCCYKHGICFSKVIMKNAKEIVWNMKTTDTLAVTDSYAQSPSACPDKVDFYVRISNPPDVRDT